ncbi:dihydroxyacetone kinase phosphoryl donor subunit DhaM [Trueperella sp. LYQ143]|uniref:dihydroxyacetone kinase phosphoryl donor subunit DhaM n=1 Tax=Trueperella sp. LYQ143 TaxID=3391059 RepID=UPI003983A500
MSNVGVVVVSHSAPLAQAAKDLALEMSPNAHITLAGGVDSAFGTNAQRIAEAIEEADTGAGVVVLLDLGSAVMSTEMALEFIDPALAERTLIVPAPLVEGLMVGAVSAAMGSSREEVAREAMRALEVKRAELPAPEDIDTGTPFTTELREIFDPLVTASTSPTTLAHPSLPEYQDVGDTEWISRRFTVTDPAGLHARPAAALAAGVSALKAKVRISHEAASRGPSDARSITAIIALGVQKGDEILVQASGPQARDALDIVEQLARRGWATDGENPLPTSPLPAHQRTPGSGLEIVVGPALVWRPQRSTDPNAAEVSFTQASAIVRHYLESLGHDPILALQIGLLEDITFTRRIEEQIHIGIPTEIAIRRGTAQTVALYRDLPTDYLRERADDVRALGELLINAVRGIPLGGLSEAIAQCTTPPVVVLDVLTPALASEIEAGRVAGILTALGSPTGHGALIAAARGIPILTGNAQARHVRSGQEIALEPTSGSVTIDPSRAELHELLKAYKAQQALHDEARQHAHEPVIYQGDRVIVAANIGIESDAHVAHDNGADGCGLVRTEILFAHLTSLPSIAEQCAAFESIASQVGSSQPINIRIWDVGADKPLPYFAQDPEDNPFLGERGIRLLRRYPQALREQFRAIIRARRHAPVNVIIPMVTTVSELAWARELFTQALADEGVNPADSHLIPEFGMMIETPAVALQIAQYAPAVDFMSIGTNDLIQYIAAADRANSAVAEIAHDCVDLVLDLIHQITTRVSCPVGVCGDLASNAQYIPQLLASGVRVLSVRPGLVPHIKNAVRHAGEHLVSSPPKPED